MCPQNSTFNASSDDTLAAIKRLSVQNSRHLDMGELGPCLGSEALDVQFPRDLLKCDSLITHGEDQPDGFRFSLDHLQGTLTRVPSLPFRAIPKDTVATLPFFRTDSRRPVWVLVAITARSYSANAANSSIDSTPKANFTSHSALSNLNEQINPTDKGKSATKTNALRFNN